MWRTRMELRVGGKYRLGRKIGSGSFGDIYLGKCSCIIRYSSSSKIRFLLMPLANILEWNSKVLMTASPFVYCVLNKWTVSLMHRVCGWIHQLYIDKR